MSERYEFIGAEYAIVPALTRGAEVMDQIFA